MLFDRCIKTENMYYNILCNIEFCVYEQTYYLSQIFVMRKKNTHVHHIGTHVCLCTIWNRVFRRASSSSSSRIETMNKVCSVFRSYVYIKPGKIKWVILFFRICVYYQTDDCVPYSTKYHVCYIFMYTFTGNKSCIHICAIC